MASFSKGVKAALVFIPVLAPFSTLFGIIAQSLDLSAAQTFFYSAFVLAGASQIASLTLIAEHAPIFIAVLAGAIVNLRFALYSAALAPHFQGLPYWRRWLMSYALFDQTFVLPHEEFEKHPDLTLEQKSRYYSGVATLITTLWFSASMVGYYFADVIASTVDISFGLPLAFIALIVPSLKSPPHIIAALISIVATLFFANLPYNLGLLLGASIAIPVAAYCEYVLNTRAQS